jgi:hypothetical protein
MLVSAQSCDVRPPLTQLLECSDSFPQNHYYLFPALGHAVSQGAGFVICPCCFRSNPHLRVPYLNDDKAVQLVTAEEFLGVDTDLYSSLGQLAELQGDIKLASKAMHTINALRAAAVDRLWRSKRGSQEKIKTSIKTFPIGFSTRNFCLVGKYDKST